jgi:hypothetical protein
MSKIVEFPEKNKGRRRAEKEGHPLSGKYCTCKSCGSHAFRITGTGAVHCDGCLSLVLNLEARFYDEE